MREFGLIGYPLGHSFSETFFREKFQREEIPDARYRNFPLPDIHELPALFKAVPGLCGLNVTIPYKESVIPFLDELDPVAENVAAVNVIRFLPGGGSCGHNTDVTGFREALRPHLKPYHTHALILGTGGASRAVAYVLNEWGIKLCFVSRTPVNPSEISYGECSEEVVEEHKLIVQTTPLGMHPEVRHCPDIPYQAVGKKHLLFDLIYNPRETLFMKKGARKGARVLNGLEMLEIQAEESWKIWNGKA